jgi:hypothetical protein
MFQFFVPTNFLPKVSPFCKIVQSGSYARYAPRVVCRYLRKVSPSFPNFSSDFNVISFTENPQ